MKQICFILLYGWKNPLKDMSAQYCDNTSKQRTDIVRGFNLIYYFTVIFPPFLCSLLDLPRFFMCDRRWSELGLKELCWCVLPIHPHQHLYSLCFFCFTPEANKHLLKFETTGLHDPVGKNKHTE